MIIIIVLLLVIAFIIVGAVLMGGLGGLFGVILGLRRSDEQRAAARARRSAAQDKGDALYIAKHPESAERVLARQAKRHARLNGSADA